MDKTYYCRFCAASKTHETLLNLDVDSEKLNDTLTKLNILSVTLYNTNYLPKTVCYDCLASLNTASHFVHTFRKAQVVLKDKWCKNDDVKIDQDFSDDRNNFDDFYPSDSKDEDDIPLARSQNLRVAKKEPVDPDLDANIVTLLSDVKKEPQDDTNAGLSNLNTLFDETICPLTPNVTIYAKEVSVNTTNIKRWSDYRWLCFYCTEEYSSVVLLREHLRDKHGRCSGFTCVDCEGAEVFEKFDQFVGHVKKHRKGLKNLCPYCDVKVENPTEHAATHQLPCRGCGELFPDKTSLNNHVKSFNSVKPKRRKRGTPVTIDELTCQYCSKVYKNKNSLRDHQKLHQNRKRDYTCERCGKTFFNKGTLTSHIMAHDQIRPHICKLCNKSFLYPNMLRRHVETHSGVKPFSCETCGRCFRTQRQLKTHKIVHTDDMPYICQYCSKAFRFKQILKGHERQHTGARPYSCLDCSMEFTNWSNYNKHMKRRHNTDTAKKKITPEGVFPINPSTGKVIEILDPEGCAEWRNEIMLPAKRGRKKIIKKEAS